MGYTTEFSGAFKLNKKLDKETHEFLDKFNRSRRMARNVAKKYGVEGEFYAEVTIHNGGVEDNEKNIIDNNRPPKTQPGLWCQWRPDSEGEFIEWDGGEKFYEYIRWIKYLIEKILAPRGYSLTGDVSWRGEEPTDMGIISIQNNNVVVKEALLFYTSEEDRPRVIALVEDFLTNNMKKALDHAIDKKLKEKKTRKRK